MVKIQELKEQILTISRNKRLTVIGIDGLGGAGKSTLAGNLFEELKQTHHTIVFHIDDFITDRSTRYNDDYPEWKCYYDLQWRYDYFVNDVIRKIADPSCDHIEAELYDKEKDSYYKETYTVKDPTIIIIEGVFLQRKELQNIYDYMIYIDIPEEIRLSRVLGRDTYIGNDTQITEKYVNRYFPAEDYYIETFQPVERADYVICSRR